MKKRLFTDIGTVPSEGLLRKRLGVAMEYYHAILREAGGYRKHWQFNHGNGWILRVDDKRGAAFYVAPFDAGVEVSLTVRDTEKATFTGSEDFHGIQPQLDAATKYEGGYALRFGVETAAESSSVAHFVAALLELRSPSAQ